MASNSSGGLIEKGYEEQLTNYNRNPKPGGFCLEPVSEEVIEHIFTYAAERRTSRKIIDREILMGALSFRYFT